MVRCVSSRTANLRCGQFQFGIDVGVRNNVTIEDCEVLVYWHIGGVVAQFVSTQGVTDMAFGEGPDRMSGIDMEQRIPKFHALKLDSADSIDI
jgi:hypothetical protein